MTFITNVAVTEMLCSFRLVLEWKVDKEIPESLSLEFLEKYSPNNFALADAEHNNSGPLNREGLANLSLLRTLLAISHELREPCFWKMIHFFLLA